MAQAHKFRKAKSLFSTTLSAGISTGTGETITLASVTGLPTDTEITITIDRVDSAGNATPTAMERITGIISGSNLTAYTRAVDGTSDAAHSSGAVVEYIWNADDLNDLIDGILVEHDQDGTHDAITATSINLVSGGTGNVTNTSLFTNALINGNMDVWQRGTSFTASANNDDVYTADRWNLISDGNDAVDITREATEKPDGSMYSMKLDTETAKRYGVVQFIENIDSKKLDNKNVSLSFAAKTTSSQVTTLRAAVLTWGSTADAVTSDIVGTWAATPTWATNWTAENTPADITITDSWATYKIEGIAIDTATVNNIAVAIWTPNEETIGDVWYLSQVQLNEGSVALPFQPKSEAEEKIDCQKYAFLRTSVGSTSAYTRYGVGQCTSTTVARIYLPFPSEMRVVPSTSVISGNFALTDAASNILAVSELILEEANKGSATLRATVAAGLTGGHATQLISNNNNTSYVLLISEL